MAKAYYPPFGVFRQWRVRTPRRYISWDACRAVHDGSGGFPV